MVLEDEEGYAIIYTSKDWAHDDRIYIKTAEAREVRLDRYQLTTLYHHLGILLRRINERMDNAPKSTSIIRGPHG